MFNNLSRREKILFLVFFLGAWVSGTLIFIRIDTIYSTRLPASGGTLTEGIVGTPRFINPLLAISDADRDLTRIIYAGLMRPDKDGNFVPQLAERYKVSDDGLEYIFTLRDDLYWHDGEKLTTEDVAFTIELAKNPAIRSSKLANWEGVNVEILSDREIKFTLNRPYAPFLGNTILGIMPKHKWKDISPEAFSLALLNTQPIGSGPFKVDSVSKNDSTGIITSYTLERFNRYRPQSAYLNKVIFRFYQTEEDLARALTNGAVEAAGVEPDEIPKGSKLIRIRLPRVVGVFFNQDKAPLLHDIELRKALSLATNRDRIVQEVEHGYATPTSLPIPPGTFAHASTLEELSYDPSAARALLEGAGYEDPDNDGLFEKVSKKERTKVEFTLATLQTPELTRVAELLAEMWRSAGVDIKIARYEPGDFEQSVIRPRDYDMLLFGQNMGYDNNPYGFWHARQIKHPGSNIALYANTKVDGYLENAQTTTSVEKREELYKFFQQEITRDKPAVFLYSPSYVYVVPEKLMGIDFSVISFPQERFSNIESWSTNTKSVWNIFVR
ncbi:MAG: hypothetical protein A3A29_01130 [Candidatus Ryanbacteria bacterium RIFCSPLOWO2_01_FULL_47_79]|nr:MAG: hypothetical protein A3A29_01130 [Candidatus Ryanbacteria bacterium RIFCSPLOWO2_01_FULL_47_79]